MWMASSSLQFSTLLWWTVFAQTTTIAIAVTRSPGQSRVLGQDDDQREIQCITAQDTYCEEVNNYPSAEIRRYLARNNSFSAFFNRLQPNVDPGAHKYLPGSDADQFYPEVNEDERRACDVSERLIRPRAAKNRKGEMRLIINDGYDYQQYVKVETCRHLHGECSGVSGMLASGYSSRCAQKYTLHLLVVFEEKYRVPSMDDFQFPTACVCFISHRFYR